MRGKTGLVALRPGFAQDGVRVMRPMTSAAAGVFRRALRRQCCMRDAPVPAGGTGALARQTRSMMIAGAMPPAAHMVTRPVDLSWRSSSSSTVPIRIEPVAPIG